LPYIAASQADTPATIIILLSPWGEGGVGKLWPELGDDADSRHASMGAAASRKSERSSVCTSTDRATAKCGGGISAGGGRSRCIHVTRRYCGCPHGHVDAYSSHDQHDTTPPTGIWFWPWTVDLVMICSHDLRNVAEGWARRTCNCVLHVPAAT
jgi:hypothetical protein